MANDNAEERDAGEYLGRMMREHGPTKALRMAEDKYPNHRAFLRDQVTPSTDAPPATASTDAGTSKQEREMAAPGQDTEAPPTIEGYTDLSKVGSGGMGVVYRALEERFQRTVAIKVIQSQSDSQAMVKRFRSEMKSMAQMTHPNIAFLLGAGTTKEGQPYFAMELIENGTPITRYCDTGGLGIKERLELCVPVCHAIAHAHQRGVIHRDVKPSNVMVTTLHDKKAVPKVIDFGIAKVIEGESSNSEEGHERVYTLGSPHYVAPERMKEGATVDARSDIYSLGVILHELVTGRPPFQRSRPSQWMSKRATTGSSIPRILSSEIDCVILKALEEKPENRYGTALELADDIERIVNDEPVNAMPPSRLYRAKKWARKHPGKFTGVVASMLVTVISLTAAWFANQERLEAVASSERAKRSFQLLEDTIEEVTPDKSLGKEVTVLEVFDELAKTVEQRTLDDPRFKADVHQLLAKVFHSLGQYKESMLHMEQCFTTRKQELGELHRDTLVAECHLIDMRTVTNSGAFRDQDEVRSRELVKQMEVLLGEGADETLNFRRNFAVTLAQDDKWDEAGVIFRDIENMIRSRPDISPLQVAFNDNDMGYVLQHEGKTEEAEARFRKAFDIRRQYLGENNTNTLASEFTLAMFLVQNGKTDEVLGMSRKVLESAVRLLPATHDARERLEDGYYVALILDKQFGEALSFATRLVSDRKEVFGDLAAPVLSAVDKHAGALKLLGRVEEARRLLEETLEKTNGREGVSKPAVEELLKSLSEMAGDHTEP